MGWEPIHKMGYGRRCVSDRGQLFVDQCTIRSESKKNKCVVHKNWVTTRVLQSKVVAIHFLDSSSIISGTQNEIFTFKLDKNRVAVYNDVNC